MQRLASGRRVHPRHGGRQPFTAQVQRGVGKNPPALRISHGGARLDTMVLTPCTAELHRLMP
jgi:propionyl-CoA carboxylase alpha chain